MAASPTTCQPSSKNRLHLAGRPQMSTRPSVMGPMRSSPPCDRHAAELTLLSVVDAKAATLCLLEGAVSLSGYACSSCDDHWPCNGFTASTVPATGLRAVGLRSAYSHLVFLLVIPAPRSAGRQSIGKLYRQPTFDAGSPRSCAPGRPSPVLNLAAWRRPFPIA